MIKKILKNKFYLFCMLISIVVLLITSKNSPLYAFNDWVDANAFYTVGKSIFNNRVPYKDIFEQKGIILYFIYGIGYLLYNKGFLGVFILEVISFSIFLYSVHNIVKLYLDEKYSIIILPILSCITTTATAFVHGGSCEEFILPFTTTALYYYLKYLKENNISNKEIILLGLLSGVVLMMKYTLLGMFIGISILIVIDYIRNKKINEIIRYVKYFLLGASIPIILSSIYLVYNGALKDFIECYFIFNIKYYPQKMPLLESISDIFNGVTITLLNNIPIMFLLFYYPFSLKKVSKDKKVKIDLLVVLLMTLIPIYIGHRYYRYYILGAIPLLIIPIIGLVLDFKQYINKKVVYVLVPIISILMSYCGANYKEQLLKSKDYFFQYKYAEYINKYDNPTLLNLGSLDIGLYTTTGIVPNTRFFQVQNIDYNVFKDNLDEMHRYVKNKEVDFVIYTTPLSIEKLKKHEKELFSNYKIVLSDKHVYENELEVTDYLFEVKR